jgi:predicted nucleotidyltransferase
MLNIGNGHKIILLTSTGSHLYGTNTETSDTDYISVFLPSEDVMFGLENVEQIDFSIKSKDESGKNTPNAIDSVSYEFRKFCRLAMENNPNILEVLFVNKENIINITEEGRKLLDNRHLFPNLMAYDKFMGYAISQQHKMVIKKSNYFELVNFKKFLDKGLEDGIISLKTTIAELYHIKMFDKYKDNFKNDNFIVGDLTFHKTRMIKKVYESIRERLNKVGNREELLLKYGYDTKFASHLIRLLSEGKMLLEIGELRFPLENKELLMDIRQGKYSMQQVLDMAEEYIQELRNLKKVSTLPKKPQYKQINELCKEILKEHYI